LSTRMRKPGTALRATLVFSKSVTLYLQGGETRQTSSRFNSGPTILLAVASECFRSWRAGDAARDLSTKAIPGRRVAGPPL
jgi:hypothetical protein